MRTARARQDPSDKAGKEHPCQQAGQPDEKGFKLGYIEGW